MRDRDLFIRVSEEEKAAIKYLADINDMTVSDLVRMLIVDKLEEEGYR